MPSVMEAGLSLKKPRMRMLTPRQVEFVLARNAVARVAFEHGGRVELLPVHYAMLDGAIVGRTSLGLKYLNWLVVKQVVVEVEEVHGLFDWKSVVVRGSVSLLRSRGTDREREQFDRAVTAIRNVIPGAFSEHDPTPDRRFIFRIDPDEVTGRESTTKL